MKLFNTMSRQKEEFIPIEEGKVKMYACGPTVYNYFHIGNARPFITFDTLRRYLEYKGYKVDFVQNFTDIDDKMITQANAEEITVRELADRFIHEYYHDADKLNIERPTYQPRATECIDDIIDMIKILVKKEHAYVAPDGVYFSVDSFENYGKLSNFNLDELEENAGERLVVNEMKKNRADFALWKFKKENEPCWESPWGEGRPGWHIECSAMSRKYLGDSIDIHCGGQDLVFPHHENEIAQSEAVTGKTFVKYWLHNGFININNHKMSKSAGNFFTIRDIASKYQYDVIRFFILSSHYRSPINFSDELLEASKNALERIRNCVDSINFAIENSDNKSVLGKESGEEVELDLKQSIVNTKQEFSRAMDDDLNTADAVASIFELVRDVNSAIKEKQIVVEDFKMAKDTINMLCGILGIKSEIHSEIPEEIYKMADDRIKAKKDKNYDLADQIRNKIQDLGYIISDTPSGSRITKK